MIKKTLGVAALLAAGVAAPAHAAEIDKCALMLCGTDTTTRIPGTNIWPDPNGIFHVYDGVKVLNDRVRTARGDYRLVLVRDTGITASSLTEAAMMREYLQSSDGGVLETAPTLSLDTAIVEGNGNITLRLVDTKNKGKTQVAP